MDVVQETPGLEQILADLVAFKSVSGEREATLGCLGYAEAFLARRGLDIRRETFGDFPSLIATTRATKRPKLLLQAHVDVVAAPDDCYRLHEKQGKLYGRGAYDMKFAPAMFLKLADELQAGLDRYDFGIMLTSDEEIGGEQGVQALLKSGYGAQVCVLPDAGDHWQIETSHKGCWIGRICASGTAAHGSRPWEGDNAIDRLMDALHDIRGLFEGQNEGSDTLSINQIVGGAVPNQIADKAEATLDMRFIEQANFERLHARIKTIAKRHEVVLETVRHIQPSRTDISHPLVVPFLNIAEQVRGRPLGTVRSLGISDAHYFAKQGIPVILVRPPGGAAHGDDEWIDRSGLHEYYEVLKRYVEAVARTAGTA